MYLVHFNGNHSRHNGQFINGDGDNDGIIDDHHNYSRNKKDIASQKKQVSPIDIKDTAENIGAIAKTGGLLYLKFTKTGKEIDSWTQMLLSRSDLAAAARDAGVPQFINRYKNITYIKIAEAINRH